MKEYNTKNPHPADINAGQQLRMLRKQRGLTQTDIANILELTFQQVQKYENGKNRLNVSAIDTLCKVLHINPIAFFDDALENNERLSLSKSAVNLAIQFDNLTNKEKTIVKTIMQSMEK